MSREPIQRRHGPVKVTVMQRLREEAADPRTLPSSWLALQAVEIEARGANPRGNVRNSVKEHLQEVCNFPLALVIPVTFMECPRSQNTVVLALLLVCSSPCSPWILDILWPLLLPSMYAGSRRSLQAASERTRANWRTAAKRPFLREAGGLLTLPPGALS